MLVELARFNCSVPGFGPVVTGIIQLNPASEVVGVPTVAPEVAVPDSEKFAAATLKTAAANVACQRTVEPLEGVASTRLRELIVVDAAEFRAIPIIVAPDVLLV